MSPDHVTARTASTTARVIIIALSAIWLAVLAWLPGRWILRQWRRRDRAE